MFDPGTKIVVLASTQKSGAGPRRGSIGHIIASGNGSLIDPNMLATWNTVGFSRFGFEQKPRFEVRTVVNLLQLLNNSTEDSVAKQVGSFHNFFNSPKLEDVITRIADYLQVAIGTPLVIMTPYSDIDDDLLTCKNSEFEAWVKSISFAISPTLYSICFNVNTFTNNTQLSKKKLQSLHATINDRSRRDKYIEIMLSDPSARKSFVQTIRYLDAIQQNTLHASRCNDFSDFMSNGIYNTYSNNRFTPETIRIVYKILYDNMYNLSFTRVANMLKDRPGKECVSNVVMMKKEFRSMSEKLLSENTSN